MYSNHFQPMDPNRSSSQKDKREIETIVRMQKRTILPQQFKVARPATMVIYSSFFVADHTPTKMMI